MYEVAVYEGGLRCGGPEEGGWWYFAGDRVGRARRRLTQRGAYRLARRLYKKFPQGADRSNVSPRDDDFEIVVGERGERLGTYHPPVRPQYE